MSLSWSGIQFSMRLARPLRPFPRSGTSDQILSPNQRIFSYVDDGTSSRSVDPIYLGCGLDWRGQIMDHYDS
ncbi:uncharacterized protein HMPREF1541_07999 [Cyphellophora europaea CBS 101466]|uniref:Uncharacterized protein n=1 Tax=Cyphellophora europaea (strain CBS 101466) TaxID=1220924 RepID=W2RKL2_CYPE1|nr:uncharacterized protein HMPREF1541_07999 [Cyphellophora europaea CBS 101466]ETN37011.1 hypothetical protein HMPREF1541_07999 [Cyphellophora europaea CBS 101466]